MDILIKNANVIDGTGKPSYVADVGVLDGKIVLKNLPSTADCVIDASGKYLTPGFIDVHSHGNELFGVDGFAYLCKINQGITTEIIGQCGNSSAPSNSKYRYDYAIPHECMNQEFYKMVRNGLSWSDYIKFVKSVPKATNCKLLIGFNTIKVAVMGNDNRKPTDTELEQMKAMLVEAMESGAVGMSSGLAYVPATYSDTEEIIEVCKAMAPYGGIYTTHMRNESCDLLASVEEAIKIGRMAGVAVNISHFKIMGRSNWGKLKPVFEAIDKARAEGVDITCDQYPYNNSMTLIIPCIPPWHFSNGLDSLLENLKVPEFREKVKAEMLDIRSDYENFYLNSGGWSGITICTSPNVPEAEGFTVEEYAKNIGKDPFEVYFDLIIANKGIGSAIYHSISDDDIFDIIKLPYVMVGTDGLVSSRYGKCHPRGWGCMVKAISEFTKRKKVLPLEELIHRMTEMSAKRYSLNGKGVIRDGYDADLVVMDYDNLKDNATYLNPAELAGGIDFVIVNGKIVYCDGALTGEVPGVLL